MRGNTFGGSAKEKADKAKPKARGMKGGKSIVKRAEDSPASASGKKMPGYNFLAMKKGAKASKGKK